MGHQTETGDGHDEFDIDLNGRNLVVIFLGLLAICGCFFVAGYILRGGAASSPSINYADAAAAINSEIESNPGVEAYNRMSGIVSDPVTPPSAVTEQPSPPPEAAPSVSEAAPSEVPAPSLPVDEAKPTPKETVNKIVSAIAERTLPPATLAASAKSVYSVQIAAFRVRREVELKAKEVKAKGFEPRIDMPLTPDDYYRLKVGNFSTRAEAVEMEKRLKESGFDTMIRENKGN